MNFEKSVNVDKFIQFLQELRAQQPNERLVIFLDRLNVHRSLRVKECCDDLGIIRVFNSSYSPNYNPIEGVIGVIKNELKRQRIDMIARGRRPNLYVMLENVAANVERNVYV